MSETESHCQACLEKKRIYTEKRDSFDFSVLIDLMKHLNSSTSGKHLQVSLEGFSTHPLLPIAIAFEGPASSSSELMKKWVGLGRRPEGTTADDVVYLKDIKLTSEEVLLIDKLTRGVLSWDTVGLEENRPISEIEQRTEDVCSQLSRFTGGVYSLELLEVLEELVEINYDLYKHKTIDQFRLRLDAAKQKLELLAKSIESNHQLEIDLESH